ncbi:MAG: hypothetical protein ACLQIB_53900 [Isosphaeraceae bacterium]
MTRGPARVWWFRTLTPVAESTIPMMLPEHRGAGQRRDLCQNRTGELAEDRPKWGFVILGGRGWRGEKLGLHGS